jgi:cytochrome c oxidase subunit 2
VARKRTTAWNIRWIILGALGAGVIAALLHPSTAAAATNAVDPNLPTNIFSPDSTPAKTIVTLSHFVLLVTGLIFAAVFCLIAYAAIKFRRPANDDGKEPAQVYGSNPVEVAWTTIPLLIVVVLALATARVVGEIQNAEPPEGAVAVELIGHQWWWEIRYPKLGVVTANELHVPVSADSKRMPTFIELRSADVAHSFWVPRLAGKTNLIPNRINGTWIEPKRTGLFLGQCAEYCGTQHALMLLRVYVHTPEEFDKWVAEQRATAPVAASVAAGRQVFERTACVNCHAIAGTIGDGRFGPDLTHLMSRDTIASGALKNSRDNLRAWVKDPDKYKPGVLMPVMGMSDTELDQLADYLASLK